MTEIKKRNPLIAAVMSILLSGLGQIYNGQLCKGILLYISICAIILAASSADIHSNFYTVIFLYILSIVIYLCVIIDAFRIALKIKEFQLKQYNRWYIYLILIILHYSIVQTPVLSKIDKRTYESYKMSDSSMIPNLSIGDRFIADTINKGENIYQRGDIVVFHNPQRTSEVRVKRVIGLPGETIVIRNKEVFINDYRLREPYVKHTDPTIFPAHISSRHISSRDNTGPLIMPTNCYFLMGDNRDLSYDSRFFNCVDGKSIHGKVTFIYWASGEGKVGKINEIKY